MKVGAVGQRHSFDFNWILFSQQGQWSHYSISSCFHQFLSGCGCWFCRNNGRVMVSDLPVAIDLAPHVGEASLHRGTSVGLAQLEGVHARVKVGIATVRLDTVVRDGAERVLLDEGLEVLLGVVIALDVLGRDSRKEGKLGWGVHVGDGLCVLGLESIIPPLEVGLPPKREVQ